MSNPLIATESGHFVNSKWEHLAEMVEIYNPQLELRWIPPQLREWGDNNPYVVVHRDSNGAEYAVVYASEADSPEEIMTNIINNDMKHGDVFERMQVRNAVNKAFELARLADEMEAKEDLTAWFMKSDKNYKTFVNHKGELVKIDSAGRQHKIRSYH